jgi:hypothetical protein
MFRQITLALVSSAICANAFSVGGRANIPTRLAMSAEKLPGALPPTGFFGKTDKINLTLLLQSSLFLSSLSTLS